MQLSLPLFSPTVRHLLPWEYAKDHLTWLRYVWPSTSLFCSHLGVRTIQNTGVFWKAVFQTPRPHSLLWIMVLPPKLKSCTETIPIPPAMQASFNFSRIYLDLQYNYVSGTFKEKLLKEKCKQIFDGNLQGPVILKIFVASLKVLAAKASNPSKI